MLVGATGNDPRFETDEYPGISDAVNCVVSCFGPMDLTKLPALQEPVEPFIPGLIGDNDPETVLRDMSPIHYISEASPYPALFACPRHGRFLGALCAGQRYGGEAQRLWQGRAAADRDRRAARGYVLELAADRGYLCVYQNQYLNRFGSMARRITVHVWGGERMDNTAEYIKRLELSNIYREPVIQTVVQSLPVSSREQRAGRRLRNRPLHFDAGGRGRASQPRYRA